MNARKGMAKMRQMPLFPLVPLVPMSVLLGSVALSIWSYRRVRRLETRLNSDAQPNPAVS